MDGWMDGRMDGWMDGWMDGLTSIPPDRRGPLFLCLPARPSIPTNHPPRPSHRDAFAIAKVTLESLDLERMRMVVTTKETGLFGNEKLSEERQDIVFSKCTCVWCWMWLPRQCNRLSLD
jgi:hypothetical protein